MPEDDDDREQQRQRKERAKRASTGPKAQVRSEAAGGRAEQPRRPTSPGAEKGGGTCAGRAQEPKGTGAVGKRSVRHDPGTREEGEGGGDGGRKGGGEGGRVRTRRLTKAPLATTGGTPGEHRHQGYQWLVAPGRRAPTHW